MAVILPLVQKKTTTQTTEWLCFNLKASANAPNKTKTDRGLQDILLSMQRSLYTNTLPDMWTKSSTSCSQVSNNAINMIPEPHFYFQFHSLACATRGLLSQKKKKTSFRTGVTVELIESLVNLFDGWSRWSTTRGCTTSSREATSHALWHTTRHATSTLVQLGDDGVAHLLQLLLLMLILIPLGSLGGGT